MPTQADRHTKENVQRASLPKGRFQQAAGASRTLNSLSSVTAEAASKRNFPRAAPRHGIRGLIYQAGATSASEGGGQWCMSARLPQLCEMRLTTALQQDP